MKILVVEDEFEIKEAICHFFKSEGYIVENAGTLKDAIDKIYDCDYDCVILDLSLPDGDGLQLISRLKTKHSDSCIVVVSARNSIDDKINGLDVGADDYLVKPFSMAELNARVKSVMRRCKFHGNKEVTFHEIKIYPESRQVFINENEIILTPKEFDLLTYFYINKNRVLTKENIVGHLWEDYMGISADSYDFIYTHIRNLRHKIVEAGGTDYIKSIYSLGYKFTDQ